MPPETSEIGVYKDSRTQRWFWDFTAVFESDLSAYAKLVRLYLARCANRDRMAWPSYSRIAKDCGISRDTAKRAIAELEEKGWLRKTVQVKPSGEYFPNVYTLCDPPGGECSQHLPCPDLAGVGADSTYVGAHSTGVGAVTAPNQNHGTMMNNTDVTSVSVSSLRSDTETEVRPAGFGFLDLPGENESARDDSPTAANPNVASDGKTDGRRAVSGPGELTNQKIIGELGDAFFAVPGMIEKYPQRSRVYAFLGRLYHRYDAEPVFRALDVLRQKPGVNDPLRYVAAVAKKEAEERRKLSAAEETARKINEAIANNSNYLLTHDQVEALYAKRKEHRNGNTRRRNVLERYVGENPGGVLAPLCREMLGTLNPSGIKGVKHIGNCLDEAEVCGSG